MEKESRIAIWDITSQCNLRCEHCYNEERYWDKSNDYKPLSKQDIKVIIDKLCELNFTRIHLLGGEPLMCPELYEIVKYGKKCKMLVTIVTNGTLLSEKVVTRLYELGIDSINVSIDGTNMADNDAIRGDGVFTRVVNNIGTAIKARNKNNVETKIGISFTLTKRNLNNSRNIIQFAEKLKLDFVNISYLSQEGSARNNFDDKNVSEEEKIEYIDFVIEDSKKRNSGIVVNIDSRKLLAEYIYKKHGVKLDTSSLGCEGAMSQFYILADGTLLPCSPAGTSLGCSVNQAVLHGIEPPNLLSDSVENVENSLYLKAFYNYTHNYETYKKIRPCEECKYTCLPCPLLYTNGGVVFECAVAKKKIKMLDEELMSGKLNINPSVRTSNVNNLIKIINFKTQDTYVLQNLELLIWQQINGENTGYDIIEYIMKNVDDTPGTDTVKKDVVEFLYELRAQELIF